MLAIRNHCIRALVLVAARALVAATPADEQLLAAVRQGNCLELRHSLRRGANANAVDRNGVPPLMLASVLASSKCVEALLQAGADARMRDPRGATALMWAIPDLAKVTALLAAGSDVNAVSGTG